MGQPLIGEMLGRELVRTRWKENLARDRCLALRANKVSFRFAIDK